MSRRYQQKARAESQEETRRRITEATVELHRTVGPARTTISAIAEQAGVQRLTVYRHFPDERDLFAACSAHWLDQPTPRRLGLDRHPPRPPRALRLVPPQRGDARQHRPRRPVDASPRRIADPSPFLGAAHAVLMRGLPRRKLVRAALGHALEFSTWRSLAGQGLSDPDAAALMAAFVEGS